MCIFQANGLAVFAQCHGHQGRLTSLAWYCLYAVTVPPVRNNNDGVEIWITRAALQENEGKTKLTVVWMLRNEYIQRTLKTSFANHVVCQLVHF
jgi:hypothetical protein